MSYASGGGRQGPSSQESGAGRSRADDLRQRATPGLVPAPLLSGGGPTAPPDSSGRGRLVDEGTDAHRALATICPYLVAEDGGWRAAEPMREHRCTAVRPPAPLSDDTQRRLCLVRGTCQLPRLPRGPSAPRDRARQGPHLARAAGRAPLPPHGPRRADRDGAAARRDETHLDLAGLRVGSRAA